MTIANVLYFCQLQFNLYGIPIRVYDNGKLIAQYRAYELPEDLSAHIDKISNDFIIFSEGQTNVYISDLLTVHALVVDSVNNLSIVLGPMQSVPITEATAKKIIENNTPTINRFNIMEFIKYLDYVPHLSLENVKKIIMSMHIAINGERSNISKSLNPSDDITAKVLSHSEKLTFGELDKVNNWDIESQTLYYVYNGMTHQLKNLWKNLVFKNNDDYVHSDVIRLTKDICLITLGMVSRVAIYAGVNFEIATYTCEVFVQKIETCTTQYLLLKLRYEIMMHFCELVQELNIKKTNIPVIDFAMDFIQEHIAEKITLSMVAEKLHMSENYLSTLFKKTTGIAFPDYINKLKVQEAKRLILFTDKSLVEISCYLSLSSQSYFQKIFKQFTGVTPGEFKKGSSKDGIIQAITDKKPQ